MASIRGHQLALIVAKLRQFVCNNDLGASVDGRLCVISLNEAIPYFMMRLSGSVKLRRDLGSGSSDVGAAGLPGFLRPSACRCCSFSASMRRSSSAASLASASSAAIACWIFANRFCLSPAPIRQLVAALVFAESLVLRAWRPDPQAPCCRQPGTGRGRSRPARRVRRKCGRAVARSRARLVLRRLKGRGRKSSPSCVRMSKA
jgi:hypothetical protein